MILEVYLDAPTEKRLRWIAARLGRSLDDLAQCAVSEVALREVPRDDDPADKPLFKVLTRTAFGGLEDLWKEDDVPVRFGTREQAQADIYKLCGHAHVSPDDYVVEEVQ